MSAASARQHQKTPFRLTSRTRRHCSSDNFSESSQALTPALLTAIVSVPHASRTLAIMAFTAAGSVTSTCIGSAVIPCACSSSATPAALAPAISATATAAPARPKGKGDRPADTLARAGYQRRSAGQTEPLQDRAGGEHGIRGGGGVMGRLVT